MTEGYCVKEIGWLGDLENLGCRHPRGGQRFWLRTLRRAAYRCLQHVPPPFAQACLDVSVHLPGRRALQHQSFLITGAILKHHGVVFNGCEFGGVIATAA